MPFQIRILERKIRQKDIESDISGCQIKSLRSQLQQRAAIPPVIVPQTSRSETPGPNPSCDLSDRVRSLEAQLSRAQTKTELTQQEADSLRRRLRAAETDNAELSAERSHMSLQLASFKNK